MEEHVGAENDNDDCLFDDDRKSSRDIAPRSTQYKDNMIDNRLLGVQSIDFSYEDAPLPDIKVSIHELKRIICLLKHKWIKKDWNRMNPLHFMHLIQCNLSLQDKDFESFDFGITMFSGIGIWSRK